MPLVPTVTEALVLVKTQPLKFAFRPLALAPNVIFSKVPITTSEEATLPKGGETVRGTCRWEDGKLRFTLAHALPKGSDPELVLRQLKKRLDLALKMGTPRVLAEVELPPEEEVRTLTIAPVEPQRTFEDLAELLRGRGDELKRLPTEKLRAGQLLLEQFKRARREGDLPAAEGAVNDVFALLDRDQDWVVATEEWKKAIGLETYTVGSQITANNATGPVYHLTPPGPGQPKLIGKTQRSSGTGYLEREAKIYEEIGDHPTLPRCLGVRSVGDTPMLVVETIDGPNLAGLDLQLKDQKKSGRLTDEDGLLLFRYLFKRTLEGLAHLHSKGRAHCDIKPENLMIDGRTGQLKLIDVAGAETVGTPLKEGFTEKLAPPEKTSSPAFDVYTLAGTLRQFTFAGMPEAAKELVQKMLSPNSEARPSVEELLASEFLGTPPVDEERSELLLRTVADPVPELRVVPGITAEAVEQTFASVESRLTPREKEAVRGLVGRLRTLAGHLALLEQPKPDNLEARKQALKAAGELCDELRGFRLDEAAFGIRSYARSIGSQVALIVGSLSALEHAGLPEVITKDLAERWRRGKLEWQALANRANELMDGKDASLRLYDAAAADALVSSGFLRKNEANDIFAFTLGLSKVLDALEKAAAKGPHAQFAKASKGALEIVKRYEGQVERVRAAWWNAVLEHVLSREPYEDGLDQALRDVRLSIEQLEYRGK